MAPVQTQRVVVCGGGVVGCSSAYYLAKEGAQVTVVEREAVGTAASGKAGGFLAQDWSDGAALGPLSRKGFELHAKLQQELGVDVGYRKVNTWSVVAGQSRPRKAIKQNLLPEWLDGNVAGGKELASVADNSTAQVHPHKLTNALMDAASQRGATLRLGCVQGIVIEEGAVQGVLVDGEVEPADAVVIAMGPWSSQAARWLPCAVPVAGHRYHSIVIKPTQPVTDHCLFLAYKTKSGVTKDPEVYPRPDGTVYICGEQGRSVRSIPDVPSELPVDDSACAALQEVAVSISSKLQEVERRQACCLPVSSDGVPMIGPVPGVRGAYMATGHGCWGILNGPATGLVMAELIMHGVATSVDISAFDPARFSAIAK